MTRPVVGVRAALLLALLAALVGWATPAGAQDNTATRTGPSLELVGQTPFVEPSDTFELQLKVAEPPTGDLRIEIDRFDDISNSSDPRGRLDAWLEGRSGSTRNETATWPVADPANTVLRIPVGPGETSEGFTIRDAGVFPLVVRLLGETGRELDRFVTFLIRFPDPDDVSGAPPLLVAPVLGVRAEVALKPDGSQDLSGEDRDRLALAQTVLRTHPDAPITVDPVPETVAATRSSTSTNPESLREAIGDRPVLSSTLVEIDVDQWVASGLRDQIERQRQLALHALTDVLKPERVPDAGTWVARHSISAPSRALLQDLDAPPVSQLVVPTSAVAPLGEGTPADAGLQPFDLTHEGGRMRAVLYDERLATRLSATGNPVADAQAALADLAILACGSQNGPTHCKALPRVARGVALVVPDDARAIDALDVMVGALGDARPMLAMTELGGLFELTPATAGRSRGTMVRAYEGDRWTSASNLADYARRLEAITRRVHAYHSMLVTTAPAPDTADGGAAPSTSEAPRDTEPANRLLRLLDVAGGANKRATPYAYLDEVSAEIDGTLGSVRAPERAPVLLTSPDSDNVQVRIENDLDHPVTVKVHLSSDRPVFDEGRSRSIRRTESLPASSASTVRVQVHAVGSGAFTLDAQVLSPDEHVVLDTTQIEVRSTVVSGVGLVLTIAAGVFLLVWWARHHRDARRARKLVDPDEIDAAVAIATGEVPAVGNAGAHRRV